MRYLHIVGLTLFVLAVVTFCLQNLSAVPVTFLGWSLNVRMPLLIILVYGLGMFSGWSVLSFLKRTVRSVRRRE